MKRILIASIMVLMFLALNGCGGGGSSPPPTFIASILSNSALDGDILRDSGTGTFTVTQGMTPTVQSVFAGIYPVSLDESRAFLHFPLTGVNGVPGDAVIVSAFLDIVITSIQPQPLAGTIPIRIDLISFSPPNLIADDFDRTLQPALATTTITPPISQSDFGQHVTVDVTNLMVEAQRVGLPNFQIRIMAESTGVIEINDTTGPNRAVLAPLLEVEYF